MAVCARAVAMEEVDDGTFMKNTVIDSMKMFYSFGIT